MPLQLLVGLGNPGAKYAATRHNVGFWLVEALARQHSSSFKTDKRFHGAVSEVQLGGERLRLLLPGTFMNRSGQAVRALAQFYKIPAEDILVVHDELDLPCGIVRLKRAGGHGGHNGLRDIIAQLGSREFLRLRLGVAHPGVREQVVDHVLSKPSQNDRRAIESAIDLALDEIETIARGELDQAMNTLHRAKS